MENYENLYDTEVEEEEAEYNDSSNTKKKVIIVIIVIVVIVVVIVVIVVKTNSSSEPAKTGKEETPEIVVEEVVEPPPETDDNKKLLDTVWGRMNTLQTDFNKLKNRVTELSKKIPTAVEPVSIPATVEGSRKLQEKWIGFVGSQKYPIGFMPDAVIFCLGLTSVSGEIQGVYFPHTDRRQMFQLIGFDNGVLKMISGTFKINTSDNSIEVMMGGRSYYDFKHNGYVINNEYYLSGMKCIKF